MCQTVLTLAYQGGVAAKFALPQDRQIWGHELGIKTGRDKKKNMKKLSLKSSFLPKQLYSNKKIS